MADKKETKTVYVYPTIKGIFGDIHDDSKRTAITIHEDGTASAEEQYKVNGWYIASSEGKRSIRLDND